MCFCDTCYGSGRSCLSVASWSNLTDHSIIAKTLDDAVKTGNICEAVTALAHAELRRVPISISPILRSQEGFLLFNISDKGMNNHARIVYFLLLDQVKPSPAGKLPTYTPSTWLKNTYAKGWSQPEYLKLHTTQLSWDEQSSGSPLNLLLSRHESILYEIVSFLSPQTQLSLPDPVDQIIQWQEEPMEVAGLRLVCRLWNRTVRSFFREVIIAQEENISKKRRMKPSRFDLGYSS